ncbi:MAG: hypothetical protein K940chlam9_00741 [Chlamydiae bacterium]|nr:hypothetical protein [Chlamydiota bacterium]
MEKSGRNALGTFVRLFLAILLLGGFLYSYIRKQNTITELRLQIPIVAKKLHEIEQENIHLQFQVEAFEDPAHLLDLLSEPEYSHLKFPRNDDVLIIPSSVSVHGVYLSQKATREHLLATFP